MGVRTTIGCSSIRRGDQGRAPDIFAPMGNAVWRTASGRQIAHTVYSLIGCPAFAIANYLLVRRHDDGRCTVLAVAATETDVPSVNLARIRHEGAKLGANEVHVHARGRSPSTRARLAFDLAAAHLHRISAADAAKQECETLV
jgi:hypothetical protein